MTLREFISENRLKMSARQVDSNPAMADTANMDHWKCVIHCGATRRRMSIVFSQGYGHNGAEPSLDSVLDCLASDASGVENATSFEDWASEYGYDSDSRSAEKIFRAYESQAAKLKALLGDESYDRLLWHTERN